MLASVRQYPEVLKLAGYGPPFPRGLYRSLSKNRVGHGYSGFSTPVLQRCTIAGQQLPPCRSGDVSRKKTPPCGNKHTENRLLYRGSIFPLPSQKSGLYCQGASAADGALPEPTPADEEIATGDVTPGGRLAAACGFLVSIFPLWVVLACGSALVKPEIFLWLRGDLLVGALAITMLGMGTTLSVADFAGALSMPKNMVAGVILQYTVMPLLGALVAAKQNLPRPYALGIILVACCPGGTASNIVTYLARGNVALSVLMTAASTLLAVVMTPLLTSMLAGQLVPVDGAALFVSTLQVVLLPVVTGVAAAHYFPRAVKKFSAAAPLVAVIAVAAVVGSAIASNAAAIRATGGSLALAVITLHGGGFLLGYVMSRAQGLDKATARTISIEVGMQNSVLGVVLATQHFADPLTAAPCAASSVCHSLLGSLIAAIWRLQSAREEHKKMAMPPGTVNLAG